MSNNKAIYMLEKMSDQLGLVFASQDWGIINAAPNRVEEFIGYFYFNKDFPQAARYELFELIVASLNEALLTNTVTKRQKTLFYDFIQENAKNHYFEPILEYWKKITSEEEFPVGKILQEIVK